MLKFIRSPMPLLLTLCTTLIIAALFVRLADAGPRIPTNSLPDEIFIVRVYYNQIADIDQLVDYDVWEFNNLEEKYVLLSANRRDVEKLEADGWRVEVDEDATNTLNQPKQPFFGGYRTVDELYADLQLANTTYPTLTQIFKYGDSHCLGQGGCTTPGGQFNAGYDLLAIRVSNENISGTSTISGTTIISGTKPVFFLMANIHSREITTSEIAMRMLDWLLDGYGTNPEATWIVNFHEVWIVPTANPDGHWLVELGTLPPYNGNPFTQRKNSDRTPDCPTWPPNGSSQYGVDLNRNHSFGWGGASNNPCSLTYRGPSAASEPEVAQLQAFVSDLIPDQRGENILDAAPPDTKGIFITMHSYSRLVLWPWGNTTAPAPNRPGLEAIGRKMATYNGYTPCQPSICLYSASGTTDDWSYGELGVPSFTYELGTQFMPPYAEVDAVQWPDNGPALQYAAKVAYAPYMEAYGPDALNVAATVNGSQVDITATINDTANGNRTITGAAYYIDQPYWGDDVISGTLVLADGTANSPIEDVVGTIDADTLSNGRHMVLVYGRDIDGNWGPAGAAFFELNLSPATATGEVFASTTYAAAGEIFSYTLNHNIDLAGTHDFALALTDVLHSDVTPLVETIQVNGVPMPTLYHTPTHSLVYTATGQFSDEYTTNITFQVQVNEGVIETTVANHFSSSGSVDGMALATVADTTMIEAGNSAAVVSMHKQVSQAEAEIGQYLTYTLTQQVTYTGNVPYQLVIQDNLTTSLAVMPNSVYLNGEAAPDLYDAEYHTIYYSHDGMLTNTMTVTIQFTAYILDDMIELGDTLANQFSTSGTVNGYVLTPQTSPATMTQIAPFKVYVPLLIKG